ncbi:putative period circadian protein [Rosellinia necatrix]|uniref:Putative period circadian protein n=1 Tax=Rosellinia necatrix TaxID=77044 RepID=A0A1S7UQ38_ROSNE|nr:putative period circadian protein [Rosellinia necatrix]
MRSFAFLVAPLLAGVALAQKDGEHTTLLTIGFTNSAGEAVTAVTTYTYYYSNPATTLLTQTNSDGIITGLPNNGPPAETSQPAVVTSQPAVVTSQPAVATIPAGLPAGTTTIIQGNSSFVISVGPSTTVVLTSTSTTNDGAANTGSSPTDGSDPSASSDGSSDPTETPGAAAGIVPASFGLVSFGALIAALL